MASFRASLPRDSNGAAEDVENGDDLICLVLDYEIAVEFVVPVAGARHAEPRITLLHYHAVDNELEVLARIREILQHALAH